VYRIVLALSLVLISFVSVRGSEGAFRVTLLGTGTPRPRMDRFGPSILVQAGAEVLVFDVGRGSLQRLEQIGVPYSAVTGVFLTHLHSDHVVGLPDLWLVGWLYSRRTVPLEIRGPAGTAAMVDHLRQAFAFDLQIRVQDDKANAEGGRLIATDVGEQVILNRNGVKVTAFLVDHEPVKPALGYRVDYDGRAVVLSGDTRKSANLVKYARGVDVLIHEVAAATEADLKASPLSRSIVAHHTNASEAAEIFREAAPKLAVFSHIVLRGAATERDIMRVTQAAYPGEVVMGEDLMTIDVKTRKVIEDKRRAE
jgi:ribonuclease Z